MSLSILVIAANVLFSYKGFQDFSFFERYKFNIADVQKGDKVRLFSAGFLHVDWTHLLFNMITFYFFERVVTDWLGGFQMLLIYFGSLLFGNLLTMVLHKNEPYFSAVGASGAVTGILYSAILLYPSMELYMFFIPIPIPAYLFGIGYLLYSIYGMKSRSDNIGHSAHFGGAMGGYVLTLLLAPYILFQNLMMVILLAVPLVLLYGLHKTGKLN